MTGQMSERTIKIDSRAVMRVSMRLTALFVALVFTTPSLLSSQGLAAIAKKEEERRKNVKAAGKVYTNDNLTTDITSPAPPPTNATASEPSTQVPSLNLPAGGATPDPSAKDEAYWRSRISDARSALERSRIFADALQSRINALTTDIVNRSDPAQRAQLELERQRALAELDRVKKEIADQTKAISDIEEEARKAGVPPGWLR
jgi:hypothetical protein